MYGGGSGIGPIAGGGAGATLAYTGTGDLVFPLVIAAVALVVGTLLSIRSRRFARTATPSAA